MTRSPLIAELRFLTLVIVVAGLPALTFAQRPISPAPQAAKHRMVVLVFPFENASRDARLDWLGEGVAELTIERLAGRGSLVLRRDDRLAALEKLGLPASAHLSRATMIQVAGEADADYVLFGRYVYDGARLTLHAQVLRLHPAHISAPIEESAAFEELMNMHARLLWRVLRIVEPSEATPEREFSQKLVRLRPDALEAYARGLMNADPEREDRRFQDLRTAARLEPAWEAPAFALGMAYFNRRDCESALSWLSRLPPAHERGLEATFYAGVCHLERNDPARAESSFASLVESGGGRAAVGADLPEALNNLAIAHARLGRSAEAEAELRRAAQLDPGEADYWFNLGLLKFRASDFAAAIRPLRQALEAQPEDAEARALLVAALEKTGQSSEAAAEREKLKGGAQGTLQEQALARLDRVKMHLDAASLRQFTDVAPDGAKGPSREPARGAERDRPR